MATTSTGTCDLWDDLGVTSRSHLVRLAVLAVLLASAVATASAPSPGRFGPVDAISVGGLRRLRFIASDALEGRDSLSPGFRAAAEYVAASLIASAPCRR